LTGQTATETSIMKTINLLLVFAAATSLGVVGCGKSDKAAAPPVVGGVTLDLPKLNEAFATSSPELKGTENQVVLNIRYQRYEEALMALDKLVNDANVTEAQKKVVNEVIEQVKKLAGAVPAAAQPAQ
jgi:hypothetical protein